MASNKCLSGITCRSLGSPVEKLSFSGLLEIKYERPQLFYWSYFFSTFQKHVHLNNQRFASCVSLRKRNSSPPSAGCAKYTAWDMVLVCIRAGFMVGTLKRPTNRHGCDRGSRDIFKTSLPTRLSGTASLHLSE